VPQVFLFGAPRPDTFVDIAEVLDVKVAALREHRSQMGKWDPTEMIAGWAREQGARRGLEAAEAYRRMTLGSA
jgi:LmbE family N-acetylglucosaminyl deacetylase